MTILKPLACTFNGLNFIISQLYFNKRSLKLKMLNFGEMLNMVRISFPQMSHVAARGNDYLIYSSIIKTWESETEIKT